MNINMKNDRNRRTWDSLSKRNEGLLAGYFVIGDPNISEFLEIIKDSVSAGIDVLEIGVPSKNPLFDGDIIKRGHERVFQRGINTAYPDIACWRRMRDIVEVPVWAMGYCNELVKTGFYKELAVNQLIDGLLIPDCPAEETKKIAAEMGEYGIDIIRFVNSSMSDLEIKNAVDAGAFIYAQLYNGSTGNALAEFDNPRDLLKRIRNCSDSVVLAGFGVRTAKTVRELMDEGFDGVVVGSALMARLERSEKDSLYRLISDMKSETFRRK